MWLQTSSLLYTGQIRCSLLLLIPFQSRKSHFPSYYSSLAFSIHNSIYNFIQLLLKILHNVSELPLASKFPCFSFLYKYIFTYSYQKHLAVFLSIVPNTSQAEPFHSMFNSLLPFVFPLPPPSSAVPSVSLEGTPSSVSNSLKQYLIIFANIFIFIFLFSDCFTRAPFTDVAGSLTSL